MADLVDFFLNADSRIILFETVEISHPDFSKVYRIVRNSRFGINAKIESGDTVPFEYYPIRIKRNGSSNDLEQSFEFTVGDLGDIVQKEIERVEAADSFQTNPQVIYRAYRSDDLDNMVIGPEFLSITELPMTEEGFSFIATPPKANVATTGEIYTLARFPGLRGFL